MQNTDERLLFLKKAFIWDKEKLFCGAERKKNTIYPRPKKVRIINPPLATLILKEKKKNQYWLEKTCILYLIHITLSGDLNYVDAYWSVICSHIYIQVHILCVVRQILR